MKGEKVTRDQIELKKVKEKTEFKEGLNPRTSFDRKSDTTRTYETNRLRMSKKLGVEWITKFLSKVTGGTV